MGASSELWGAFLRSGAMLALVIAVLVLVLYGVKRFSPLNRSLTGKKEIQVIAAHHLAPREKLVLVQVLDRKVLIGVTPQTITTLALFDKGTGGAPAGESDFSELIHQHVAGSTGKGEDHDA
jgi:flagellar protein FliO/FliZ